MHLGRRRLVLRQQSVEGVSSAGTVARAAAAAAASKQVPATAVAAEGAGKRRNVGVRGQHLQEAPPPIVEVSVFLSQDTAGPGSIDDEAA